MKAGEKEVTKACNIVWRVIVWPGGLGVSCCCPNGESDAETHALSCLLCWLLFSSFSNWTTLTVTSIQNQKLTATPLTNISMYVHSHTHMSRQEISSQLLLDSCHQKL